MARRPVPPPPTRFGPGGIQAKRAVAAPPAVWRAAALQRAPTPAAGRVVQRSLFRGLFKSKPKLPSGQLIDGKTNQVLKENFVPTEEHLATGAYWLDEQGETPAWYYLENFEKKPSRLVDSEGKLLQENFKPSKTQLSSGKYWLDIDPENGTETWYFLENGL
jgi:hypothetical protein